MSDLNAAHYLYIYRRRLAMHEKGITNPREEIKVFVRDTVDKLSKLPSDEIIILDGLNMIDSNGNIIAEFPEFPSSA